MAGNILLTNFEDVIQCISVNPQSFLLLPDHYCITFKIVFTKPPTTTSCYFMYSFSYSKENYDIYRFYSHNVETIWLYIKDLITATMRLFIPFTKFHSHQHPSWFTPQIRHH